MLLTTSPEGPGFNRDGGKGQRLIEIKSQRKKSYKSKPRSGSVCGAAWKRGRILASHPAAPGLNLSIPKNFYLDVAEIY